MTQKQKLFIEEYLIDLNATQAAIRAGYSPDTAQQIGSENLSKPVISTEISKAMAERSRRTGVSADRVVLELAKIGFAKITDIVDLQTAEIKEDVSEDDLACIQSIKVKPNEWGTEKEIKMYDKRAALVDLGKHLGDVYKRQALYTMRRIWFWEKASGEVLGRIRILLRYGQ